MKLLIITQVIDTEHPILGFFHRWVEEFAKHCEHVHVICLQAGRHSLPANVTVHSLGKEAGLSRLQYLIRFYSLIWSLRHEYGDVFVHMNQEYVLLGSLFWKLNKKKIMLWRNHKIGSLLTTIAGRVSHTVFYTSSASYTASFKNSIQMPIGIDTRLFSPQLVERKKHALLYVGRIAPIKRVHAIVDSLKELLKQNPRLTLTIVGGTANRDEEIYKIKLQERVEKEGLPVVFSGPVSWIELPSVYSQHELCINVTEPGAFDKVIGEAVACECDIVTTNLDLKSILGQRAIQSIEELTPFLQNYCYSSDEVSEIREKVIEHHGLDKLVRTVLEI